MTDRHSEEEVTRKDLVEFRLTKLEEAVSSLSQIKETVLKWDAKFTGTEGLLQCPMHKERLDQFEKRMDKLESIVADLDKFKWKAVGVLGVLMLIAQVFGSTVVDRVFKKSELASNKDPVKIELILSGNTNATPVVLKK